MLIQQRTGSYRTWLPAMLPAIAGLLCVEAIVASLSSLGLAAITGALLAAAIVGYAALRWPVGAALALFGWLALEKIIEPHLPLAPTTMDSYGDDALVVALLWVILLNLLRRQHPILAFREIGPPLVGFVALGIVSASINAESWHIAELGILSTTHSMIMFLVLVNVGMRERHIYRAAAIMFGFMALSALVAILQAPPHSPAWKLAAAAPIAESSGLVRVMGLFEWPNSLADYLAIALPLGILPALFGAVRGRPRTLILYVAAPMMLLALILAGSREAWGALPVATLFLGLTVERKLLRAFARVVLPGLVLAALLYQPFLGRLASSFQDSGRARFFQASLPVIAGHPWLGVGPGLFGGHVAETTNSPIYLQYDLTELFSEITTQQIDMFWTHLVAESGVIGTAFYLAAIAVCFMQGRRAYRQAVDPRRRALLLGLLFAIPTSVFVSFVSPFLEATNSSVLFWGLMAMLCTLARCVTGEARAGAYRP